MSFSEKERQEEFISRFALNQIKGIGPITAKKLISSNGSAKQLYNLSKNQLEEAISNSLIRKDILNKKFFSDAERELDQMEKLKIQFVFSTENTFPFLLSNIPDAPTILYYKGKPNWNEGTNIAIVGTRKPTTNGIQNTQKIIETLHSQPANIISGLALGIDETAHQEALNNSLKTFAILAHGLDRIYPNSNKKMAEKILSNGAILTEFSTQDAFNRENFLQRNRLIAGMSKYCIIVESQYSGGAMTTAKYAFNYDRELYALPGKMTDSQSQGCNFLIKNLQAQLMLAPEEVSRWFGSPKPIQKTLFIDLTEMEQTIVFAIQNHEKIHIDDLAFELDMPSFQLLPILLDLEFKEVVQALAGKYYAIR